MSLQGRSLRHLRLTKAEPSEVLMRNEWLPPVRPPRLAGEAAPFAATAGASLHCDLPVRRAPQSHHLSQKSAGFRVPGLIVIKACHRTSH